MLPEILYFRAGKFVDGGHRSAKSRGAFWIAFWVGNGVGVLLGVNTAQKPRRSGDSEGEFSASKRDGLTFWRPRIPKLDPRITSRYGRRKAGSLRLRSGQALAPEKRRLGMTRCFWNANFSNTTNRLFEGYSRPCLPIFYLVASVHSSVERWRMGSRSSGRIQRCLIRSSSAAA